MAAVLLSRRAQIDMRRLGHVDQERVRRALAALASGGANVDVRPLVGSAPWRRLRVGDVRVIFQRTRQGEEDAVEAIYVGRIVNRRDLDDAIRGLPML